MNYSFFYPQNIFLTPTYDQDRKTILESFEELSLSFDITPVNEKQKNSQNLLLEEFEILKGYNVIFFIDSVLLHHKDFEFHLILLSINSGLQHFSRHEIREQTLVEYEFIAMAKLRNDYSHVLMRPEMFGDKVGELLNKVEVDFKEEPDFSSNYFVLSDNEQQFREKISRTMLHTIGNHKGLYIEIVNNHMVIQMKKRLSKESLLKLGSIAYQIIRNE